MFNNNARSTLLYIFGNNYIEVIRALQHSDYLVNVLNSIIVGGDISRIADEITEFVSVLAYEAIDKFVI